MEIRQAHLRDAASLVQFNIAMAWETERHCLQEATVTPGVTAVLRDETKGCYYVAIDQDQIVGQAMITFEWSDWRNGLIWWIQSVYVLPERRRQGIFRALYAAIRDQAELSEDCCGLRLYVEKDNRAAQQTYQSLGMRRTAYLVMEEIFEQ